MKERADIPEQAHTAESSAQAQLLLYARDLRTALHKERERTVQLAAACEELRSAQEVLQLALATEQRMRTELELAHRDTVLRLMAATRFKDEETGAHVERVSRYSRTLAQYLGLDSNLSNILADAAPMHDVGKLGLPDAILHKAGPLTPGEVRLMRQHTTIGAKLLQGSDAPLIRLASEIALTHHERWDGSGYPRGLERDATPIAGRIVMFADQYDALRSARPYKTAHSHDRTCSILLQGDGRTLPAHFDPAMLEAFRSIEGLFDRVFEESTSWNGDSIQGG